MKLPDQRVLEILEEPNYKGEVVWWRAGEIRGVLRWRSGIVMAGTSLTTSLGRLRARGLVESNPEKSEKGYSGSHTLWRRRQQ